MNARHTGPEVLFAASEAMPLVKTGGLADVAGALPAALAEHGVAMTTLVPGYPAVIAGLGRAKAVHKWASLLGEPARLLSGRIGEYPLLQQDDESLFHGKRLIFLSWENHLMFAAPLFDVTCASRLPVCAMLTPPEAPAVAVRDAI